MYQGRRWAGRTRREEGQYGDGKVYFFSETGETLVLEAGHELKVLARNDLGQRVVSSPAVSDGRFFIRSDEWLSPEAGATGHWKATELTA